MIGHLFLESLIDRDLVEQVYIDKDDANIIWVAAKKTRYEFPIDISLDYNSKSRQAILFKSGMQSHPLIAKAKVKEQ